MTTWPDLKNKIALSIIFGIAIAAVLAMYADLPRTVAALQRFTWQYVPLILGLTLINYALRFAKWHYYLGQIDAGHVSLSDSLKIFVAGFTMVMTPGKVGELYKAWALKETNGVGISRAAPIVLAERLTDGVAMVILGSSGLVLYRYGGAILLAVVLMMAGFVIVVQIRPLALWFLRQGERIPLVSRFAHSLYEFYESAYRLLGLKNLLLAVGLGVISWAAEGLALYETAAGLGRILDHRQVMPIGHGLDLLDPGLGAEHVDRKDRPGPLGDLGIVHAPGGHHIPAGWSWRCGWQSGQPVSVLHQHRRRHGRRCHPDHPAGDPLVRGYAGDFDPGQLPPPVAAGVTYAGNRVRGPGLSIFW